MILVLVRFHLILLYVTCIVGTSTSTEGKSSLSLYRPTNTYYKYQLKVQRYYQHHKEQPLPISIRQKNPIIVYPQQQQQLTTSCNNEIFQFCKLRGGADDSSNNKNNNNNNDNDKNEYYNYDNNDDNQNMNDNFYNENDTYYANNDNKNIDNNDNNDNWNTQQQEQEQQQQRLDEYGNSIIIETVQDRVDKWRAMQQQQQQEAAAIMMQQQQNQLQQQQQHNQISQQVGSSFSNSHTNRIGMTSPTTSTGTTTTTATSTTATITNTNTLLATVSNGGRSILFFILMWRIVHLYEVADKTFTTNTIVRLLIVIPLCTLFIANLFGAIVSLRMSPPNSTTSSTSSNQYTTTKKRLKAILNLDKFIEILLLVYYFIRLTIIPPSKNIHSTTSTKEVYVAGIMHSIFFLLQSHAHTKLSWNAYTSNTNDSISPTGTQDQEQETSQSYQSSQVEYSQQEQQQDQQYYYSPPIVEDE